MTCLVEQHRQIRLNEVSHLLKHGHGFKTIFSRRGEKTQTLNALWHGDYLIFEWFKDERILTQKTYLTKTKTNFKGARLWWQCPKCSRNCGALFDYGGACWCRACGNLK